MADARSSAGRVAPLALIRIALLAGVLLFGAVVWWLHRTGQAQAADADTLHTIRQVGSVVWLAAVLAEVVLFAIRLRGGTRDVAAQRSQRLMAWAAGESVALLGGVYYLLSNDPQWYAYGLVFFVLVLLSFPARID